MDIDLPGMLLRIRAGMHVSKVRSGGKNRRRWGSSAVKYGLKGYRLAAGTSGLFAVFPKVWAASLAGSTAPAVPTCASRPGQAGATARTFHAWQSVRSDPAGQPGSKCGRKIRLPPTDRTILRTCASISTSGRSPINSPRNLLPSAGTLTSSRKRSFLPGWRNSCHRKILTVSWWMKRGHTSGTGASPPSVNQIHPYGRESPGLLAGIADTGSLLLVSGAGQTLTASLLPEVHIVVMGMSQLLPTLADALELPQVRDAICRSHRHRSIPHRGHRNDPHHRRPWSGRTARLFD